MHLTSLMHPFLAAGKETKGEKQQEREHGDGFHNLFPRKFIIILINFHILYEQF